MYVSTQCGGLHGHVKVAPDGTVYIPNRDCSGTQSIVVSEDNGVTWALRPVNTCTYAAKPSLVGQGDDPAVTIDTIDRLDARPGETNLGPLAMYDIGDHSRRLGVVCTDHPG